MNEIIKLGERTVGKINGDIFYTIRTASGYMILCHGYGISVSIMKKISKKGVKKIKILYCGKKIKRICSSLVEDWYKKGKRFDNYGDMQLLLGEKDMDCKNVKSWQKEFDL